MAAVPIYVWNGTAWQETGPVIPASPIKYQASAPSSPSTGDIWVDSDGDVTTGSQQFQRFRFVASGGETSISGVDANGATLAYTAGTEIVALNGSTLVRGQDYTATNGTSITGLSPALVANDVVEVFSFMAFNVANTYTQSQVDGLLNDYMGMRLIVPSSATNGTISASGAVTFTGVSSVSLNNCFTSTYNNYKIMLEIDSASANNDIRSRLRASGTDDSNSQYIYAASIGVSSGSVTYMGSGGKLSYWRVLSQATADGPSTLSLDIYAPKSTAKTSGTGTAMYRPSSTTLESWALGLSFDSTTSFDGITFYTSTGTATGTVRVYGYKN